MRMYQRRTRYQRMAAVMIIVLLVNLICCNGQTVFAREREETAGRQVCAPGEYSIETVVTEEWEQGYNGEIILTNLSEETMEEWWIQAECGDGIISLWNGILTEGEDGYCICWSDYNREIPAGGSVTVGYTASGSAKDLRVTEVSRLETGEKEESDLLAAPAGVICEKEGYRVEFRITESWEKGYNAEVLITNTSADTIHNWGILFETDDRIRDLYNAQEAGSAEGRYLMRNSGYNQDIPSGGSVRFGYTAEYDVRADIPVEYAVSSIEREVICENYRVSSFVCNAWEDGAVAEILIENLSESVIEDWILEFDANIGIEEVWNAQVESHEGEHYILRNASYAQNIMAGETAVAGMRLSALPEGSEEGELLRNIMVREILPGDGNGLNISDNNVTPNGFPEEDIVRLETGGDTGEIYYKVAYESDVVMAPDGLPCIKRQFLLAVDESVTFSEIEAYLDGMGAWIVGYIEITGDYQVEMKEETDMESVQDLIGELRNEPWTIYAGFNYVWLEEPCFHTTDPWSETGNTAEGELNTASPGGNNWGLELIDFEGALRNAGVISSNLTTPEEIRTDHLTTVKMGLYDSAFDRWHEDLADNFVEVWQSYDTQQDLVDAYFESATDHSTRDLAHGTHVAGTMCAGFNNGVGINGICIKNELYGFAQSGDSGFKAAERSEEIANSTFSTACGFITMITRQVKIINYSMGITDGVAYAASVDTGDKGQTATHYLDVQSEYMDRILSSMLRWGYDFLIVSAAGNGNALVYYPCDKTSPYIAGYISATDAAREDQQKLNIDINNPCTAYGKVEARYNNVFNYIPESSPCYEHIICVGAVYLSGGKCNITFFSNGGNRVEIYAPGKNIYSSYITNCVSSNGVYAYSYVSMEGTSMAAPHVSGVAGLACNVNPNLSAVELKSLILENVSINNDIKVLNAAKVVEAVVDNVRAKTAVRIHVTDQNGNDVPGAQVEIRNVTGWLVVILGGGGTTEVPVPNNTVIRSGVITDEQGMARIYLPQGNYFAVVDGGKGGVGLNIMVEDETGGAAVYEALLESYDTKVRNSVAFQLYNFTKEQISAAEIRLRSGWNQRDGEYVSDAKGVSTFFADAYGITSAYLPRGAYTVEITGCYSNPVYFNIVNCPSGNVYVVLAE